MKTCLLFLLLPLYLAGCSPTSDPSLGFYLTTFAGSIGSALAEEAVYQQSATERRRQEIINSLRHQELLSEQRKQTEYLRQQIPPYRPSAPQFLQSLPRTRLYGR